LVKINEWPIMRIPFGLITQVIGKPGRATNTEIHSILATNMGFQYEFQTESENGMQSNSGVPAQLKNKKERRDRVFLGNR